MKASLSRLAFIVLALGSVLALPAIADGEGGEFGLLGGLTVPDDRITGDSGTELEPTVGLRAAAHFTPRWSWFVDGLLTSTSTVSAGDAELITGRTGFEFFINPDARARWFLTGGGGYMNVDFDAGPDRDSALSSLGIGQRIGGRSRTDYRWELRADRTLDDKAFNGSHLTQIHGLFGLSWGPGAATDTDGDGVIDKRDLCAGTPAGVIVDERGCPSDSDGDGVFDGLDKCGSTPRGWPIDADGCALDSDGDGVPDGKDRCPATPAGATVDAAGCPSDEDGDGVFDGIDRCAGTPAGATVDATGCPGDDDGDGVANGLDQCPNTPRGATVNPRGCSVDSDGDGVPDDRDRCPDTPQGTTVDANGCPRAAQLFEEQRRNLVLEGVMFELNSAVLTAESRRILDGVRASLVDWPEVRVEIGGHTDSSGGDKYNLDLSARRARAVREYLIAGGVDENRLVARGYGEVRPIADNRTSEGRAKNRRVELTKLN